MLQAIALLMLASAGRIFGAGAPHRFFLLLGIIGPALVLLLPQQFSARLPVSTRCLSPFKPLTVIGHLLLSPKLITPQGGVS
jgi:hypothetical protein